MKKHLKMEKQVLKKRRKKIFDSFPSKKPEQINHIQLRKLGNVKLK